MIIEPSLPTPIDLRSNERVLRRLAALPRQGNFSVVHTHCAKPGAGRRAHVAIERRLGRLTDATLCVGTGIAVKAIRRGLAALERVRVAGVVVSSA